MAAAVGVAPGVARLPGCAELVGAYTYQWAVELVY